MNRERESICRSPWDLSHSEDLKFEHESFFYSAVIKTNSKELEENMVEQRFVILQHRLE